jgi:hypothetical protein
MIKSVTKLHIINKNELTDNSINEMAVNIKKGETYIIKSYFENTKLLLDIKNYLHNVGNNSLPSYYPLEKGIPNHHRIVDNDARSYVKSVVHQYLFHPWNQGIYDFFSIFKEIYQLKNKLSSLEKNQWLENNDFTKFVPRIAFHHYPVGGGYIANHSDPVSEHQLVVPILQMSEKGNDFKKGGLYAVGEDGQKIYIDNECSIGDLFLFNAEFTHGVTPIDSDNSLNWFTEKGRWMLLCSTIKTNSNIEAADAVDMENN